MKNSILIYLFACILGVGCYSCDNEDHIEKADKSPSYEYISPEAKAQILAQMTDTTVYLIDAGDKLGELSEKFRSREEKLLREGYTKLERLDLDDTSLLKAAPSVQKFNVEAKWVLYEPMFVKCIFTKQFCDEFNINVSDELKIQPLTRYLCEWRVFGTFYNLQPGQRASPLASPKAGFLPSKKENLTEREYEAYLSPDGKQFQMHTFRIHVKYKDVNHSTIIIAQNFPWGVFECNYAVLSL